MQWIEHLFGIAPDGGDGSLERILECGAAFLCGFLSTLLVARLRAAWRRASFEARLLRRADEILAKQAAEAPKHDVWGFEE